MAKRLPYAKHVSKQMKDNTYLPNPVPAVNKFQAKLDEIEAHNEKIARLTAELAAEFEIRDHKHRNVNNMMRRYAHYVNNTAQGDPVIIASSGLQVGSTGGRPRQSQARVAQVQKLEAKRGKLNGEVLLKWATVRRAKSYIIQYSTSLNDPKRWKLLELTTGGKAKVALDIEVDDDGTRMSKRTYFRIAGNNGAGHGPWSMLTSTYVI
mgnify:CR=1 FL=1